jgi:hypothetical protein
MALLAVAAFRNIHQLNPDGIAYLRLAHYYADGPVSLVVSGYWGPMLSWVMAPFLKLGCDPLITARIVMGLTAAFFYWSSVALFRSFRLPAPAQFWGACVMAMTSVLWSVYNITPDVLLAGMVACALIPLVNGRWLKDRTNGFQTGALWAMAYLVKAIALPLTCLVVGAFALLWWRKRRINGRQILRQLAFVVLGIAVVAGPWIATLSVKYRRPTFSTSGAIAHKIAGPPAVERYHPAFRTLHQPEPGRLTAWEDPSEMAYPDWSALESGENARHQAKVIFRNAQTMLTWLGGASPSAWIRPVLGRRSDMAYDAFGGVDLFWLGLTGLMLCALVPTRNRGGRSSERWRWVVLPVAALALLYLPVYIPPDDRRYFYPLFPLVWVATVGAWGALRHWCRGRARVRIGQYGLRLIVFSFMMPAAFSLSTALVGMVNPASEVARDAAERLSQAGIKGPVAGSALLPGGRAGLYMAFFMDQSWLGDMRDATPADYTQAGAHLVVLLKYSPMAEVMDAAPGWRRLDGVLSDDSGASYDFPLVVFQRGDP